MNKKNIILGGVLVILVALAYFYQGPLKEWRANSGKPDNFLSEVDVNSIDKIEITKHGDITILEKQGGRWKVGGTKDFYVKDDLSNSLISALEDAVKAKVELSSSNKDKKSGFQTDQESGISIKLRQEDQIVADFIIGKRGVDFTSTYISEPKSDETYSISADLTVFNRGDWHDRIIFSDDKEKISKIRFQYPDREFTITSAYAEALADKETAGTTETAEKKWEGVLPYKFSVDQEKIDKILDIMSDLTAAEIPEQTFENTGLEKNLIIMQATGEGIDNTLMIGGAYKTAESLSPQEAGQAGDSAEAEELYYAKKDDSDNIYLITKEQRDELDKRIWELK